MKKSQRSWISNKGNDEDIFVSLITGIMIFVIIKGIMNLFSNSYIQILITILILTLDKGSYESVLNKKISQNFSLFLTKIKVIWVVFYGCIRLSIEYKQEFKNFILQLLSSNKMMDYKDGLLIYDLLLEMLYVTSSLILCIIVFNIVKLLMYIIYFIWSLFDQNGTTSYHTE